MNSRNFALAALAAVSILLTLDARAQEADLSVTKTAPATAAAGSDVPFDITVTNLGPDPAANVLLNDPIPEGMAFVSLTQNSGTTFLCSTPNPGDQSGDITCSTQALAMGASANFTLTLTVPAQTSPGTSFSNVATISSDVFDPNDENNSSTGTVTTPQAPQADLGVTKNGPPIARAGTDVTYTIAVTNSGPATGTNIALNDTLPGTMTFVSLTQTGGPALNCTTPAVGAGGTITCTAASMAAGTTSTLTLAGNIPANTPSGTQFVNVVTVTSDNDLNEENDVASTGLAVASADVAITKSAPASAASGSDIQFVITVANAGPDPAETVQWNDTLNSAVTFVSIVQNTGPGGTCVTPAAGSSGTVSCTIPELIPNQSSQFTITAHITTNPVPASVSNTATLSPSPSDANPANDQSTTNTTVVNVADLSVTKSGPATINAGNTISYAIAVTNAGPSPAFNVSLTDTTPPGTTASQITFPAGWSCVAPVPGGTGTYTCTIARLDPNVTANFTLILNVDTTAPNASVIANTANVSSPTDSTPGNNTATSNATVINSADVSVTKSGPATINAGTNITYAIAVANAGPTSAFNVTLTDTTPAGTTASQIFAPAGWQCVIPVPSSTGTHTCTIARLDPNVTANFTLILRVNPSAPNGSVIANTATVSAANDTTPGNNTATANATVVATSDVQVTKSGPAAAGSATNVAYTVVVTNAGPADAQSVTLTDAVPAGATFVSVSQNGAAFNCVAPAAGATGTVTCTIPTLTAGASTTFTITVTTAPNTSTTLTNTANVSSVTTDPNPANNTATATTTVSPSPADLSIVKTSNAPSGTLPGAQLTYTLAVANAGPAAANGVTVTDVLPPNVTFVSANSTQGSCTGTTTVTCSLGTMNAGSNATITIVVTAGTAFGPVVNTATVTSTNVDPDPNPANNTSTVTVNVVPTIPSSSPLSLTLTALALAAAGMIAMRMRG